MKIGMASLPEIIVIQASDTPQHTARLRKVLQKLKTENRIRGFTALGLDDDLSSVSDTLQKDDMILLLLTRELEEKREQIENRVKALKAGQPGIRIAEILVDHLPYDKEFITFPADLQPIRDREDMDGAWSSIGESLRDMFLVREPESDPDPEKEREAAKVQKQSGNWSNALKIVGIIIGLGLAIFVIGEMMNGNNGNGVSGSDGSGAEQDNDQSDTGIVTTSLSDRPPIPLNDREGAMIFGNYSNRDMDPGCTVTGVSARLVNASGTVDIIEDAVGTNNLHVGIEYAADREMARVEITWEVEHPGNVECTVR